MARSTRGTTHFRALALLILAVLFGMSAVTIAAGSPYLPQEGEGGAQTSEESAEKKAEEKPAEKADADLSLPDRIKKALGKGGKNR